MFRQALACVIGVALSLSAVATPITFAWDADLSYPVGVTYDLEANSAADTGITDTQHTLDVPGNPGDPLNARVRAVPPAGYQCGDPPADCQPSDYDTLNTVIPGLAQATPWEQYGLCATKQEVAPVADPAFGAIGTIDEKGGNLANSMSSTITGVQEGDLVLAFIQRDGMDLLTGVSATGVTFSQLKSNDSNVGNGFYFDVWGGLATQDVSSMVITASFSDSQLWGTMSSARYSGVASATPAASSCNTSDCTGLASSSTQRRAQAISPGVRSLLVFAGTDWNDYRSHTPASGWTERMDGSGSPVTSIQFLHDNVQDAGTYGGAVNISTAGSDQYLSVLLAFEASDQGGGTVSDADISESATASASTTTTASAACPISGQASAAHTSVGTAASLGAIARSAVAISDQGASTLQTASIQSSAIGSDLHQAIAAALTSYADSVSATDARPTAAQAIANVIDQAIASDSVDTDLAGLVSLIQAGATTSDAFNAFAVAYGAIAHGALAGEQWIANAAALAAWDDAATAEFTGDLESTLAQDGNINEQSIALESFVSAVNAISEMSGTASAVETARALIIASSEIADAATATDVYDSLVGDNFRSISDSAAAGDAYKSTSSTLAQLMSQAAANESHAASQQTTASETDIATASDGYDATIGDVDRSILGAATATDSNIGTASVYSRISAAVSAAIAANVQVASIVGFSASAIASESFVTSEVEDATFQKLQIAAISVTRAITATFSIT